MKYLCHVTAPIITTIDGDNLRGEPRWERNVFDSFIKSGRDVHSTFNIWNSEEPKPINFHDGVNAAWQDDSILITHGGNDGTTNITQRAKYYIVQYFDGPTNKNKDGFLKYNREKPGCIFATCSYRSWTYLSSLQKVLGSENVECIHGPSVPYVVDSADNFKKPNLYWGHRNFLEYARKDVRLTASYINMIGKFLNDDPSTRFVINVCTYWERNLMKAAMEDGREFVFSFPFMAGLLKYKDRVDVVSEISWNEVLSILKNTRLVVSPPTFFSAVVSEAAMFGVPTVLCVAANPFQDASGNRFFDDLLVCTGSVDPSFLCNLNNLFYDYNYYKLYGNAYRKYVKENATYAAYINKIDEVTKKRGWI